MAASEVGEKRRIMDSTSPSRSESIRVAARSSLVDSLKGCGFTGVRIQKQDLKRRILIPEYLRLAMRDSIRFKNPNAGEQHAGDAKEEAAPEAPMVVFVNSKSGGRNGTVLKGRLQELMGEEQVRALLLLTFSLLKKKSDLKLKTEKTNCILEFLIVEEVYSFTHADMKFNHKY